MVTKTDPKQEKMLSKRELFLQFVAQTSEFPSMLEVERAEGVYIFDVYGKRYFDMNSGICVSSIGHCHPKVLEAIQNQTSKYLHTMVYGEHIQSPQVQYARLLCRQLPENMQSVYFLMTGTEAVEAAMKLAKRITERPNVVACSNAYHGSTQGAESLRSDESYKRAFYPLIPGIKHIRFNASEELYKIDNDTACVILEPVQAEAGIIVPENHYLKAIRDRCDEAGALMILDEIQTGFGRTGELFAFQKYQAIPDILVLGKAMGGGVPLSAFVSSKAIMNSLIKNPALGHITTFGGHPLSCAAAMATLEVLLTENMIKDTTRKAKLINKMLQHSIIKEVRHSGLMMAVELHKKKYLKHVIKYCFENGVIVDYFLFNSSSFRLTPPLIISDSQITEACKIIVAALDYAADQYSRKNQ